MLETHIIVSAQRFRVQGSGARVAADGWGTLLFRVSSSMRLPGSKTMQRDPSLNGEPGDFKPQNKI
jgi:hypothetical protein